MVIAATLALAGVVLADDVVGYSAPGVPEESAVAVRAAGLFDFEGRAYSSLALRGELRGPIEFAVVEIPFLAGVHDAGWHDAGVGSLLGSLGFHWRSFGLGWAIGTEIRAATASRVDAPAFWVMHRRESNAVSAVSVFLDVEFSPTWGVAARVALGTPVGAERTFWAEGPIGSYAAASWAIPVRPWLGVVGEAEVAFDDPPFSLRGAVRVRPADRIRVDAGLQFPIILLQRTAVLVPFAELRASF